MVDAAALSDARGVALFLFFVCFPLPAQTRSSFSRNTTRLHVPAHSASIALHECFRLLLVLPAAAAAAALCQSWQSQLKWFRLLHRPRPIRALHSASLGSGQPIGALRHTGQTGASSHCDWRREAFHSKYSAAIESNVVVTTTHILFWNSFHRARVFNSVWSGAGFLLRGRHSLWSGFYVTKCSSYVNHKRRLVATSDWFLRESPTCFTLLLKSFCSDAAAHGRKLKTKEGGCWESSEVWF